MSSYTRYGDVALGVESAQPAAGRRPARRSRLRRLLQLLARALARLG